MARTKADAGKKAGGKAPRKAPVLRNTPSASGGVKKSKNRSSAGSRNSVCKRPVPKWQVSVKDLAWMKPGSSKDQEAEVIDLEPDGSSTTTCGGAASSSVSGDEEYGGTNSENCEESIGEEGVEDDNERENGIEDDKEGENGREEGEIDSDESMEEENGEVSLVEDIEGGGVEISDNHEVSTTGDLVKRDEDVSLGKKVSIDNAEEKICGNNAKELNKNDENSEISGKENPKGISDAEIVAVVVKEAEELNKSGENFEIVEKDPKKISGAEIVAEMHEENAE